MVASEPTVEMTVLKRVIEVIVRIVAARIMSDPVVVVVHVRGVGMTGHVGAMTADVGSMTADVGSVSINAGRRGTVRRNVATAEAVCTAAGVADAATAAVCAAATTPALRKGGMRNDQEYDERSKKFMHCSSTTCDGKGNAAERA
jgi:hypothetical protein